ncbi:MAG: hypothetical protein KDE58_29280, partial [Caldilineaceae bacterium]|nr:hypothetical protein [Caldilineaceae bacterium]
ISLAAHPYPINALQSYRIFSHNPQITLRSDLQNETSVVLFCKLFRSYGRLTEIIIHSLRKR